MDMKNTNATNEGRTMKSDETKGWCELCCWVFLMLADILSGSR